jgi:predicted GNAT family N-acyltransferase
MAAAESLQGEAAYSVQVVSTAAEMAEALALRRAVFIEEQGVPEEIEIDEFDDDPARVTSAVHVLLRRGGTAIATGRLLLDGHDGAAHIGRVAVRRDLRRQGHGRALMEALHDVARARGCAGIVLAAQTHAIGFYERLGYVARGEVFFDAGIEHRWMDLQLAPAGE